jgi:hypothetical protein
VVYVVVDVVFVLTAMIWIVARTVSTTFLVPREIQLGAAELIVIANGIRSDAVEVTAGDQVLRPGQTYRRNLVQSTFGGCGNFELLVPQGNIIHHYFRSNDDPQLAWHLLKDRQLSYFHAPNQLGPTPRSVTFLQSNFLGDGVHGNFEAIVRASPAIATEADHLDFWFLDSKAGKWNGPFPLIADGQPVKGVTGS